MRRLFAGLFLLIIAATPAHAAGDVVAFSSVLDDCVQVGGVRFGKGERWAKCEITRLRWASTIGLADIHQAQYCLGGDDGSCSERALLLFANRAYTPVAHLLLQRVDPASTEYDDPLVVKNRYGYILTLVTRHGDGRASRDYYLWRDEGWQPIDTQGWRRELGRRLPRGVSAVGEGEFDPGTMSANVDLTSGGVATIEMKLQRQRLTIGKLALGGERKAAE